MGWRIAHQAGQVFLQIPAHVVGQPVDLSRQLHIALNTNGGLVAPQGTLGQGQGRQLGHLQPQIRGIALARQVEQACRRDQQRHGIVAPLHARNAALLAAQALHGLGLLHQNVVDEQHGALMHFVDQPLRRLRSRSDAVKNAIQK